MFDGSHRTRRTIDLGGAGRNRQRRRTTTPTLAAASSAAAKSMSTTTGSSTCTVATGIYNRKSEILETSTRQREERRKVQLQQQSAMAIQRTFRGYASRKHLAYSLLQSAPRSTTLMLSMALSPPLRPFINTPLHQLLLDYQAHLDEQDLTIPRDLGWSAVALRRIVPAVCHVIGVQYEETMVSSSSSSSSTQNNMQRLLTQLLESTSPTLWGNEGCIALVTTCQDILWNHPSIPTDDFIEKLWKWSSQATAAINTNNAIALLSMTLLCCGAPQDTRINGLLQLSCPFSVERMWSALVECVTSTPSISSSSDDSGCRTMQSLVQQRLQGRQVILLSNAIQSQQNPPAAVALPLIQYFLAQQPQLSILASMVASQGATTVRDLILSGPKVSDVSMQNAQDNDDDSNDDDDDDDEEHVSAPSSAATGGDSTAARYKSTLSSRITRQELQTVPKLDRLYQDQVLKQQRETLEFLQEYNSSSSSKVNNAMYKESMVELAIQISDPNLWQTWGTTVLNSPQESYRHSYLQVLYKLLLPSSGLRSAPSNNSNNRTSPLLSQLAFSQPVLEALWRNVLVLVVNGCTTPEQEELLLVATTLFCNVFSHYLIALSDVDFLNNHTTANGSQVILAEHVIVHLRTMLYDLYWTKPVTQSDFSFTTSDPLKSQRAILLLAGTKLWNSLYEIWCRLLRRAPFCQESTWWFPRLISRDDRAAVISVHDRPNDNNDDDGDESVESMDVDNGNEQDSNDALADSFRDPKMARILTCIPQALPFERRVKLFNSLLAADKLKTQDETAEFRNAVRRMIEQGRDMDETINLSGREQVEIRRDALYGDAKSQLDRLGRRLKHKVQVSFINEHGAPEAGIDGGGVFKEFLDDLIKEAFDPSQHKPTGAPTLFAVTPSETLAVHMAMAQSPEALPHFEFLGRVLGKAVYESILVEPQFCLPFLNQLLGKQNSLEDLKNLDNEYYTNLIKLRSLSEGEINDLGMTFEITLESGNSTTRNVELLPNGSSIPVTKDNVIQYVHLVAHQRLNVEAARPTRAFLCGFRDLVPASWVRLFSSHELQKLISGDDTVRGIDVAGLKAAMQYAAGYHPSQSIVQWFWQVLEEMTPDQQRKFLRFMTSCSRQPLLGFQALEPAPCIQQVQLPDTMFEEDAETTVKVVPLPTSATCMNLLKLPNYRSKELLRKKLLDAVESGAGFELT